MGGRPGQRGTMVIFLRWDGATLHFQTYTKAKANKESAMNTIKKTVLGATLLFVIVVNTQAEGLYKCMVDGKPVYQQSSCATNDGKRLDIDMDSIRRQEAQAAEIGQARAAARRAEQERDVVKQAAEREQQRREEAITEKSTPPVSISREDQAKIDNIDSDLRRTIEDKKVTRGTKEVAASAARTMKREIYSKYGVDPIGPESSPSIQDNTSSHSPSSRNNSPTVINRSGAGAINPETGEYLTPSGGGYIGTRDGRYYAPAGPNGVIDTQTGRFIPNN